MEYIKLNNGVLLPKLGFGTIGQNDELVSHNVAYALDHGYDLIDTANRYGNEVAVGKGLKLTDRARDSYFVESKLGPTLYENNQAIDGTLERLGIDYLDVMVLHHPVNNYIYAYKMLEKAYKEGKVKVIGICNFPADKLEELIANTTIVPQIMQIECHPFYPGEKVMEIAKKYNIAIQSWYPLGHGSTELLENEVVVNLANKYHKTPAQIVLRWHLDMNFAIVPGSKSETHIFENADLFDFKLNDEDMQKMASINRHEPFYHVTEESLHRLATTKCNFE